MHTTIYTLRDRFNDATFPNTPYLGFEQPTNVSHGTSANLDKLALLFVAVMALAPLAMAAYGANFGVGQ